MTSLPLIKPYENKGRRNILSPTWRRGRSGKVLLAEAWRMMSRHDSSDKILCQLEIHLSILCFARLGLELWKQQFSFDSWLPVSFCQWGTRRKLESRRGDRMWACIYLLLLSRSPQTTPSPWQQELITISNCFVLFCFGIPRTRLIVIPKSTRSNLKVHLLRELNPWPAPTHLWYTSISPHRPESMRFLLRTVKFCKLNSSPIPLLVLPKKLLTLPTIPLIPSNIYLCHLY